MSFVLLVLAVYTANLAAMLAQEASKSPVASIEEAIKAGYTFCASRKIATKIQKQYSLDSSRFVPDPLHLGGDGEPGFNCPDCAARTRVFDFMKHIPDDTSLYCHGALASLEDLHILHATGSHCNKTKVGEILAIKSLGIPIYEKISSELMSWLHHMKYEGYLEDHMNAARPNSMCPAQEADEEDALSVKQLTGIWTITLAFALAGILAKCATPSAKKKMLPIRKGFRHDQWGNPVEMCDRKTNIKERKERTDDEKSITGSKLVLLDNFSASWIKEQQNANVMDTSSSSNSDNQFTAHSHITPFSDLARTFSDKRFIANSS